MYHLLLKEVQSILVLVLVLVVVVVVVVAVVVLVLVLVLPLALALACLRVVVRGVIQDHPLTKGLQREVVEVRREVNDAWQILQINW
jgi:hypothetical protein